MSLTGLTLYTEFSICKEDSDFLNWFTSDWQ